MTGADGAIIDFDAARARLRPSSAPRPLSPTERVGLWSERHYLDLSDEARDLPLPFRYAVEPEIERIAMFDAADDRAAAPLKAFLRWRRYDVATGTIDGERVGRFDRFEDACRAALSALRAAIDELKKATQEPGRRRVAARRRLLTLRNRELLVVLFRFGRRRIDHSELEWHSLFDGAWTRKRWREPRARATGPT